MLNDFLVDQQQRKLIGDYLTKLVDTRPADDFLVVCDHTNNSDADCDAGVLNVELTIPHPARLYQIAPGWVATTNFDRRVGEFFETAEAAKKAVEDALSDGTFHDGKITKVFETLGGALGFVQQGMPKTAIDIEIRGVFGEDGGLASWGIVMYELSDE